MKKGFLCFAMLLLALEIGNSSSEARNNDCKGASKDVCNQFVDRITAYRWVYLDGTCESVIADKIGNVKCTATFGENQRITQVIQVVSPGSGGGA